LCSLQVRNRIIDLSGRQAYIPHITVGFKSEFPVRWNV
jgi:hypothetical protein